MARLLFWAAAIFSFVMGVWPHGVAVRGVSDKVEHVAAFATLGLLAAFAYPRIPAWQLILRLSLFGASIEVVQAIPVLHRDSELLDWVADTLACGLVLLAIGWWRRTPQQP
jgi:hypothetical protein